MNDKKFFIGLDIGTESVGWAVTDGEYRLQKYRGNLMWGVHLFDEANQAAERRAFRTERRRLDRQQDRVLLLQELIAPAILEKDPNFFLRIKEGSLLPEDAQYRTGNLYFDDPDYNDAKYHQDYPTIHHLICELISNPSSHDVRLVYIACAYLLKHRGHFLRDVEPERTEMLLDFSGIYGALLQWMNDNNLADVFPSDASAVKQIMQMSGGVKAKEQALKAELFREGFPKVLAVDETAPTIDLGCLLKLMAGGTVKLSVLFGKEEYRDLEKDSVCVASSDFADMLPVLSSQLDDGYGDLLLCVMNIYEWSLLMNMIGDDDFERERLISRSKVKVYEDHRRDLNDLKEICREYLSASQYNEIFRDESKLDNYVWYSYHFQGRTPGVGREKRATQEEFCKFITKYLKSITPNEADRQKYTELLQKASASTLCPRQVTTENRVIPYQLNYLELKQILERAKQYIPLLCQEDSYGTIADKILSIMTFRIPYYVGPLVSASKSSHAWLERKKEGRIYPWNFDEMVDRQKCEDAFIRRMVGTCSYLAGEPVLPKFSLLYSKFCVLNEINTLAIDGERISATLKQDIFHRLFEASRQRVTKKRIKDYLVSIGAMQQEQTLSGVDDVIKSTLKSYHDFQSLLSRGALSEMDVEEIIERITVTTEKKRLRQWLKSKYPQLAVEDVHYLSNLGYQDYGRLSRRLLETVYGTHVNQDAEAPSYSIMTALWETNENLMQLLSDRYTYYTSVLEINEAYYNQHPQTLTQRMDSLYLPQSVRRSVTRTLEIAKELKKLLPHKPDRIFIEMARGGEPGKKGKRTLSRKRKLEDWMKAIRSEISAERYERLSEELNSFDEQQLRSEKLFLYFMQLGKCMYSGKSIELSSIGNDALYNIDHIYPQSKTMDDSLDNKVLVLSSLNGQKTDRYPIDSKIRRDMSGFWLMLRRKNLISPKKYERLTRSTPFSDEELCGFIQRQLVETRQSTKAISVLLKELFPETEIVYVKAGLVSQFRYDLDLIKCREVNDLHHAKDAYLNIVIGNVYHERFTKQFFERIGSEQYSLRLYEKKDDGTRRGLLTYPIKSAWDPNNSVAVVRSMMKKNSIRYVRYCYRRKGGLFLQQPDRAKEGLVPKKAELPTEKYGGYNNCTASTFMLVKYNCSFVIIPVELMWQEAIVSCDEQKYKYAARMLSVILKQEIDLSAMHFPLGNRLLKINTLMEVNGYRVNLVQKTNKGRTLGVTSAESLIVDHEIERYIKRIATFAEKSDHGKKYKATPYDGITKEKNQQLYECLCSKCESPKYAPFFSKIVKQIRAGQDEFMKKTETEQALVLLQYVLLLKTGRSAACNLVDLGASSNSGKITLNSMINKITGINSVCIVDQSPTGLIERKSKNLLDL